jgi:hypothetical protein
MKADIPSSKLADGETNLYSKSSSYGKDLKEIFSNKQFALETCYDFVDPRETFASDILHRGNKR